MFRIGLIKYRFPYRGDNNSSLLWFRHFEYRQAPEPTISIFGDTRTPKHSKKYYFYKCRVLKTPECWHFSERRAPENGGDPSEKSPDSWVWGRYLPGGVGWFVGNIWYRWCVIGWFINCFLLMVNGYGSWLLAHGSKGLPPPAPPPSHPDPPRGGPGAPWARSHEPWTINH